MPYTAVQSEFVAKHKQDMMVVTLTGTSVNHGIAQKRAITGNEAWSGRTLQELVALEYGDGYADPERHDGDRHQLHRARQRSSRSRAGASASRWRSLRCGRSRSTAAAGSTCPSKRYVELRAQGAQREARSGVALRSHLQGQPEARAVEEPARR